jgi:hypothetical protein
LRGAAIGGECGDKKGNCCWSKVGGFPLQKQIVKEERGERRRELKDWGFLSCDRAQRQLCVSEYFVCVCGGEITTSKINHKGCGNFNMNFDVRSCLLSLNY